MPGGGLRWERPPKSHGSRAHRTITRTLEQEGRGTRLSLVHAGSDPVGPAPTSTRTIMDGTGDRMSGQVRGRRWDSLGKAVVKAVIAGTPPVHVHLLMHLHVNRVMIRVC